MDLNIRAVGFDLDGTFLKTHVDYDRLRDADRTVAEAHGIPFDEIDFGDYVKRPRAPIRSWLEAHGRGDEFPAINREMDDLCTEIETEFVSEAEPFPGSLECIDQIKSMGYKVGLLTRGSREYARQALGRFGVFGKFDAVVGRDYSFYDNAKPSPIAMREFAHELGVEPEEILYVGDSLTDFYSARDAGACFVGVLSGSCTYDEWKAEDPHIKVFDYASEVVTLLQ